MNTFVKSSNGVVINNNKNGYREARKIRENKLKNKERIDSMDDRIMSIESTLNEILSLLKDK